MLHLKINLNKCFDVDNPIDYQIICQLVYNWDSWGNNWLWFTYDGKKYFCGLYDCDASWGIGPGDTAILPIDSFIGQKMFVMMIKYYKERLVSRYKYLRDLKIIDRDSIMNKFLSFHRAWGSEYFEQEFKMGRFVDGKREAIEDCINCSKDNCPFNLNGKCWNANNSVQCSHKPKEV